MIDVDLRLVGEVLVTLLVITDGPRHGADLPRAHRPDATKELAKAAWSVSRWLR
jgi:hypothetical protein